jgi:uncharacterized membrane protein YeaQ/YmgE (transglycosylase-associated protein family)
MLNIIWAIIAGLIIGLLAKLVVPGRQSIPLWLTIILGIVGALIGNWLAALFGVAFTGGIDWIRHILQIAAAAVLIAIGAPVWMRRGTGRPADRHQRHDIGPVGPPSARDRRQWPARPFFTSAMATATTSTASP